MPDMHISTQSLSAPPPAAAPSNAMSGALPGDVSVTSAGAGAQAGDAFAALLAGRLGVLDAAGAKAGPANASLAATPQAGAAAPAASDEASLPAQPIIDPQLPAPLDTKAEDKPAKDADTAGAAAPALPDATAQLLAAMGALPQKAASPATVQPDASASAPTPAMARASQAASTGRPAPAANDARPATGGEDKPAPAAEAAEGASGTKGAAVHAPQPNPLDTAAPAPAAHATHAANATPPAAAVQSPAVGAAPAAPNVHMTVPGPVGTPLWREEFSASVSLLATQKVSAAELRVQPAELGPVQVSIRIEGGEANITCAAQHADTRHAMEAALPRLREMLEANGIAVGNASVGPQSSGGGNGNAYDTPQGQVRTPFEADTRGPVPGPAPVATGAVARAQRLLDVYA